MKKVYAIALAGVVSLLAINGSMAQSGSGQTGGNASGSGSGSEFGRRRRRRRGRKIAQLS